MWTGQSTDYFWIVSSFDTSGLIEIIRKHHKNQILYISAFDGGSITPTQEEREIGWRSMGNVMASPPLQEMTTVPHEQYDEWYLSHSKLIFPKDQEVFVNNGDFNLANPIELTKDDDPTWERGRYDFLYSIQERFWQQMTLIDPETYVSTGNHDIVVSKNRSFMKELTNICITRHIKYSRLNKNLNFP